MLTKDFTLTTRYNSRKTVTAKLGSDGTIRIYTEREIPTPDDQTIDAWFHDIRFVGYDLEDLRCTTISGNDVVLTGYREAEPWEAEQLSELFPDVDEDEL